MKPQYKPFRTYEEFYTWESEQAAAQREAVEAMVRRDKARARCGGLRLGPLRPLPLWVVIPSAVVVLAAVGWVFVVLWMSQ
jgi:hypothetical protein